MGRRRNRNGHHPALGAFLGSFVGAIPGSIIRAMGAKMAGSVIIEAGWIGGGALGGYYGASTRRRKGAALGGAVGGIFTPIGAAIGGYLGGRGGRRSNPRASLLALGLSASVLAVGAGYAAYHVNRRRQSKKSIEPAAKLQGILGNSTLEEAQFVVGDIAQPIALRQSSESLQVADGFDPVPKLQIKIERPNGETTIEQPAGAIFGPEGDGAMVDLLDETGDYSRYSTTDKAIAYLITGLSTDAAQLAYELALIHLDAGVDWSDPSARDTATAEILTKIAPSVDWSEGMSPYAYGGPESQAWIGVQIVGTIANQSYYNKRTFGDAA